MSDAALTGSLPLVPTWPIHLFAALAQVTGSIGVNVGTNRLPATASGDGVTPCTHAMVVLGYPLPGTVLASVITALSRINVAVLSVGRLGDRPVTARELLLSAPGAASAATAIIRSSVAKIIAGTGVDITVESISSRRLGKRLVAFDVDSTLLRVEIIDMLAARVGREREVRAITKAAMRGDIDFTESLCQRVAALAGLPVAVLNEVAAEAEFTPGARFTVQTLRHLGLRCGAISSGFKQVVQAVATELSLDFFIANELEIQCGRLTGRIVGQVIDRQAKAAALRRSASSYGIPLSQCVAVGDGANDIDMLTTSGLGVAFNATPTLRKIADTTLSQPSMEAILFILGISDDVLERCGGTGKPELSRAAARSRCPSPEEPSSSSQLCWEYNGEVDPEL
jgi:phosphoserine phosphatase